MLPRELLAQVRRIEIKTSRLVNETFAGKYLSAFKGRGMEFAQVREYVPGDDVRAIDWNVTARAGKTFVREYQEERELTLIVACDLSASQFFGSAMKLKRETAAELAAVLAFSALKNNDKVGLFLFAEQPETFLPPRKGQKHALAIIRDLLAFEPKGRKTRLGPCIDTLNRLLHRRAIILLISDFQDEGWEPSLRRMARKHDLIPVLIEDPREEDLPRIPAWLDLEDPETGERVLVHAGTGTLRDEPGKRRRAARQAFEDTLTGCGLKAIRVGTDKPFIDPVARYFRERSRRLR